MSCLIGVDSVTCHRYSQPIDNATGDNQMRTQFIQVETLEEAQAACPWAAEIVEVDGGFQAFESVTDYETWQAQE